MNDHLIRHIEGALIGVAYGDAMGMPTEYWTREQIKEVFPKGVTTFMASTKQDFFHRSMKAGEVTDDTINTILILKSLIDGKGNIDVHEYLNRLLEWVEDSSISKYVCGPNTMKALDAIQKGESIQEAGKFGTTNGAAMKIVPIGFISDYRNKKMLIQNVEQICLPTHNTNIAIAGASIVAACVSYGIHGGKDMHTLWDLAVEICEGCKGKGHPIPAASLAKRLRYVQNLCESAHSDDVLDTIYETFGTGVETMETIPVALAIVSLAKGNAVLAAQLSASLGGDTDTIGAISTAICGSMFPEFDMNDVNLLASINQIGFHQLAKKIAIYSPFYK